jgi:ubiquinone/menaquinone biosynthesis C-methylase UbiE
MPRWVLVVALSLSACRSTADPGSRPDGAPEEAARASYDRFRQPDRVVAALGLARGQRVADVGAGRGYLTFRLADAVGPTGRVVATDIDDAALDALRARMPAPANVVVRKVAAGDPGLEPASFDLILLSAVDQYLADRVEYLTKLRAALAPGGRIAVTNRRSFRAPLLAAAERAGYVVVSEVPDLPVDFLVILEPARK